jgi:hypothetical protein
MISEFERLDVCPVTGLPVVVTAYKLAAGANNIRGVSWCSNAGRCLIEHGTLADIPSCLLHHVQVSLAAQPASGPATMGIGLADMVPHLPLEVTIGRHIADLIPGFMENRRQEASDLAAALASSDYARMDQLAQRMVGVGSMYGFDGITILGKIIRRALTDKNKPELKESISHYWTYLARVRITYSGEQSALDVPVDSRTDTGSPHVRPMRSERLRTVRDITKPMAFAQHRAQAA